MTDLHYLSATEASARVPRAQLSPVELMEAVIARADEVDADGQRACHRYDEAPRGRPARREARYIGKRRAAAAARGHPDGGQGGGGRRRPAVDAGLADLRARWSPSTRRRSPSASSSRGDRPRPHDGAGVLVRRLHPLAAARRDPQPVEPRVRGRRLLGRLRRGARRGHGDAGQRLRHRRLDPHPGQLQRRRRLQAAVRPRAGRRRRSTSTSSATSAPLARTVADCALFENALAGPHPRDHMSLRPKRRAARALRRRSRACGSRCRVDLGDWPLDPEVPANTLRPRRRAAVGGRASSRRSTSSCPAADVDLRASRSTST